MRINNFLPESAVQELADKLPTLKRTDYDAIDALMKRISLNHNIHPKKLHDLFVSKYGHTPDHWIKNLKSNLDEEGVAEGSLKSQIADIDDMNSFYIIDDSGKILAGPFEGRDYAMSTFKKLLSQGADADIIQARALVMKLWNLKEQGVAEDDAGDVEQRMRIKIEREKQRLAQLKKTDPAAYQREMAKRNTSSKIPPVSTFEQQGVAEGINDTVYPNAQVIKSKNGKPVGEIYQDANGWGCFHYRADRGYDGIDSREDAIAALKDLHQEIGRSRPDYTIKGVVEDPDVGMMPFNEDDMEEGVFDYFKKKPQSKPKLDYDAVRRASSQGSAPRTNGVYMKPAQYYADQRRTSMAESKVTGKTIESIFESSLDDVFKDYGQKKINEEIKTSKDHAIMKEFIQWTSRRLHLKEPFPRMIFSDDTEKAQKGHHTGVHTPEDNTIWIYTGKRNMVDIMRTVFHELVHERQAQLGMIKPGDSYPGSPIEVMADMLAGKYIKIFGKNHPEIFQ